MVIRDPVHGDLRFSETERRVMDSRQFQRLRGVRQTGTAYLVYPGCVHTRFEHSLGTAAMAKQIISVLKDLRAQGRTVVVVHHDLATVPEYFDVFQGPGSHRISTRRHRCLGSSTPW